MYGTVSPHPPSGHPLPIGRGEGVVRGRCGVSGKLGSKGGKKNLAGAPMELDTRNSRNVESLHELHERPTTAIHVTM